MLHTRRLRREAEEEPDTPAAGLLYAESTGVALLDNKGRFIECNQAFARIDGTPRADHLGRSLAELLPQVWRHIRVAVEEPLANCRPVHGTEINGRLTRGSRADCCWLVTLNAARCTPPQGRFFLLITDLTERRSVEDRILCGAAGVGGPRELLCASVHRKEKHNGLSARKRQILALIGNGRTTKEIAAALSLSGHTVGQHRKNICRRLCLHSTAELVAFAALLCSAGEGAHSE